MTDPAILAALIYQAGTSAGMTRDQVDEISRQASRRDVLAGIERGDYSRINRAVTAAIREAQSPTAAPAQTTPMATSRQVDYIMQLLAERGDGVGGGFMAGPTSEEDIKRMTKRDASRYIDSLTERY